MFALTPDQAHIAGVLDKTGCLTVGQAVRLLRMVHPGAPEDYAVRVLRQLQYMQRLAFRSEGLLVSPGRIAEVADADMLAAVDIMLDVAGDALAGVSTRTPPFALCFLVEQQRSGFASYGVVAVAPGEEARVSFQLEADARNERIVIFLLRDTAQGPLLQTARPHYFAVFDDGKCHYFKGGG